MRSVDARTAVVIITRDRQGSLLGTLERLATMPERPPVVVVDNGSGDGTVAAVRRRFPDVRLEALPENRGAAARTVGVRSVDAPYVAFSDDDSWWAPGALATAADHLDRHPDLGLVAARIVVEPDLRMDPVSEVMATSPLPGVPGVGPGVLGFVACGAVVRRSAYLEAGGFHPRFGIGGEEDLLAIDLASRGWRLAYAADAVAHHRPEGGRPGRRSGAVRNELWTAWLRRPAASAVRRTLRVARAARQDAEARWAVVDALSGLRWVVTERRRVPVSVERSLRRLEA
ncbi:MAG TPA: glycosyltransferase [Actinomycetota bacterium]|nr:glycosyltransferase [Actinomycetota bacterium]